jgi:RNA polymerase sigma-70 factor (ECF subfamily)
MIKVVVNESLNFLRSQRKLQFVGYEMLIEEPSDEEVDVESISIDELHRLIRELPDGYRTVLNLYVFEELSHRQIAELLHIKESTSSSQLYYAKQWLAKKIKGLNTKKL